MSIKRQIVKEFKKIIKNSKKEDWRISRTEGMKLWVLAKADAVYFKEKYDWHETLGYIVIEEVQILLGPIQGWLIKRQLEKIIDGGYKLSAQKSALETLKGV